MHTQHICLLNDALRWISLPFYARGVRLGRISSLYAVDEPLRSGSTMSGGRMFVDDESGGYMHQLPESSRFTPVAD